MKPTTKVKPIYENDRKGPRMKRGKFSKMVVSKELYKEFKKKFPEYSKLTWDDFFARWKEIAETIRIETITNPLGVKLGSYSGELKLQYLPYKFETFDHVAQEDLGTKVKLPNILTRGKVAKIKWERRWAVKFNKMLQFFQFQPVREMNMLAKDYVDRNPDDIRMSRNTLGGESIWRRFNKKR